MKYIGAHVSSSGGVEKAPVNAHGIGATAFALFVKNQRRWTSPPLLKNNINRFKENCEKLGYPPGRILPHDSYLINLAHPEAEPRQKSLTAFKDEVKRCEQLGLKYLNFHPGSHLRQISEEQGLDNIAECLNNTLRESSSLCLVIENTAGQGSNLGYQFEHLAYLISKVDDKARIGVCLDTCHAFTSGYDLVNDYTGIFTKFEEIVGFQYLKGMHINDSKKAHASRVDRHQSLGEGFIAGTFFKRLMQDPRFDDMPLILETPVPDLWPGEIKLLQSYCS